ncbi:MAG: hypothetical protein BWZ10_03035 [candidate division BRC1 bacterium ADurb.BinA364]|nr:MAG: hypothetical protein BWZ10_03035 [candidate division BRC1 bacterium ADurb.BinA364]
MAGKYIGVLFAAGFCYTLFMAIFLAANWTLRVPLRYDLFAQGVYLQFLSAAVIVALAFLLSLVLNVDAAITLSALLYFSSQVLMTLMSYIYDSLNDLQQAVVMLLHFLIPQLTLFDVSGRIVHGVWPALPFGVLRALTLYAAAYAFVFLAMAYAAFRRKSL